MNKIIGFVGGGNMATSLIGGLLNNEESEIAAHDILVYEPDADKAQSLEDQFAVQITANNQTLVKKSDIVVLAVKPQVLKGAIQPLAASFQQTNPLIISIVAGITCASIEKWLDGTYAIIRVMPNTPALIGAGISGMYANNIVAGAQRRNAELMMSAIGQTSWVTEERDIDAVTALSGSGPAYFMLFMQALIEAAVDAGLQQDIAKRLAIETAIGAAKLVDASDEPMQTLIDNVTSPGGTTEQALNTFNEADFTRIVQRAFSAAHQRSKQLAKELGDL